VHVAETESNLADTSVHDQETSDQLPEDASSLAIEPITVEDVGSTAASFTEAAPPADTLTEVKHVEEQEEEAELKDTEALETAADLKEHVEAIGSIEDDSLPEKKPDTAVSEPITAVSEPMPAVPEPSAAVPEPPQAVPEPTTAVPELAPVHQPGKTTSHELSPKPEEKKARSPSPSVVVIDTIHDSSSYSSSPRDSKEASPVASIGVIEEDPSSSLRGSKEASPAAPSPLTNGVAAAAEVVTEKEASPAASPLTNGVAAAEKEASPVSSLKTVEDAGEEDVEVIGSIDED
jgi:hypothetical protein